MPFTLVKGTFIPGAGIPDGDSVRFKPDNIDLMRSIPRVRMSATATTVQLRFEGIDALEKHAIQPHATDARDLNLQLLGTQGANDDVGASGFILTREGDKKSGRPICFVYSGETDKEDGHSFRLESEHLPTSVNYRLLEEGMAYPLFYETLFAELRVKLTEAFHAALVAGKPYISLDASQTGVTYEGPNALDQLPPIFPKLFRRLDDWNGQTLDGFLAWLAANDNERVHTLSDGRFIGFQDTLEVNGNQIRLKYAPDDMVFRPKPFGPPIE